MSAPYPPTRDNQGTPSPNGSPSAREGLAPAPAHDGTPGTRDLRDIATTTASAVVVHLLGRQRDEWHRSIADLRAALVELERTCEAAVTWQPQDVASDVADLVEGLVAAATAEVSAATARARAEARVTIDQLHVRLGSLETESREVHEQLILATSRQRDEQQSRLRADAALAELQRRYERDVAELQAELRSARLRVETERVQSAAFRAQMTTSLEHALRAIRGEDLTASPSPELADGRATTDEAGGAHGVLPSEPAATPVEVTASPTRGLTLVAPTPASAPADTPEESDYITALLAEVEAKYDADIRAHLPPLEVVDRLTSNLRQARDHYATTAGSCGDGASNLFKHHLTSLFNARADTAFGRHLGISWYELYPVAGETTDAARKVS